MKTSDQTQPVSAREETIVLPTYVPGPPDPNPMFLERRVNQGASGRVYPNPLTDRLSSDRQDRAYQAVWLENEYIQLMILPQIGGRVHVACDKTNGHDFIYRQHVVKPAMIGLFGPWISGGMEFNWPQHHRPSTFMQVYHLIEAHEDGSRTVWLSDHDPLERTKGMVGICLHPGRAVVEFKVQLYNRTPFVQTFLWWVNIAVHVNDQYQLFFPPDVASVTDHSKRAMAHYPIAREVYYGVDYGEGVDISWCKNNPVSSSFFAAESRHDFFGGYDHGRQAGVVHVANHHISPGKKLFTWGTEAFARAWEGNLTDADGPYIELMAGAYTDNQPDFSWIQPYETRTFSQYLYPIQQIGPAQNANRRAAVSLEGRDGKVRLGVYSPEALHGAALSLTAGDRTLFEQRVDLAPGAPLVEEVGLDGGIAESDLLLRVCDAQGRELIRYAPEVLPEEPLPEPKTPPPPPAELKTNDELYLTGVHLEQYRHPTIDPEPYWEEALRRDPGDSRSHTAMGLLHLRRGEFPAAEDHLRRAVQTLTHRNPNPRDGESHYVLGLALRYQQRFDEAYAALYKATWSYAWQTAGYCALAEIDCRRGDLATALEHLDRALITNARNSKARNLKAAVLRRLGRKAEARTLACQTVALDPLDFWARNELVLLQARPKKSRQELAELMRGDGGLVEVQLYLDLALDYAVAGLWDEASGILARLVDAGDPVYPMVLYALGYFAFQQGKEKKARNLYRRAASVPPDYCFPARLEELEILRHVLSLQPDNARARYFLGNLLYDKKHYDEAVQQWEQACRLESGFSIPWRNLGIAHYNVRRDPEQAKACYLKAFASNSHDSRLLIELDQLMARLGASPAERLARLEEHLDLVEERDDLCVARAALYNQTGGPQKALDIVLSRRFHPWEGGEGRVSVQYVTARMALGQAALEAGRPEEALSHFEAAQDYPENLGEGKHPNAPDAHVHYFAGLAREALKDDDGAAACFQRAAKDQRSLSAMTYYQALAMEKLGQQEAARQRLQELLDFASEQLESAGRAGFDTSVPRFVFEEDDPQKRRRIANTCLLGLAQLGLGQKTEAEKAFREVVELDPNHAEAREELRRLSATS